MRIINLKLASLLKIREKKVGVVVVKASITDFFDVLKIKRQFSIDEDELENNYLKLQQKFHPDNLSKEDLSSFEISLLLKKINMINCAYSCIKNPIERARHLIELHGFETKETNLSKNYLLEIMKLKEEMNDESSKKKILSLYDEYFNNIKNAFAQDDYSSAQLNLLLLKYIGKLKENINGN
jgi:molecular chaperone HscB